MIGRFRYCKEQIHDSRQSIFTSINPVCWFVLCDLSTPQSAAFPHKSTIRIIATSGELNCRSNGPPPGPMGSRLRN